MDNVLDTLFHPFTQGDVHPPAADESVLFLNAAWHPALESFKPARPYLHQYFKPYAALLQERGFSVSSEIKAPTDTYDLVLVALPKNALEAKALLGAGAKALKPNGRILCAADNKAGGTRIAGLMAEFGFTDVQSLSKNKARLCLGVKKTLNTESIENALSPCVIQIIPNGRFLSIPGIFGWDRIDRGSEMLTRYIPNGLSGKGADFGCGYGYLSHHVLTHCPGVTGLAAIDADARAIVAAQKNLKDFGTPKTFLWEDLTKPVAGVRGLDFIVMNPPFHEGKKTDADIGRAFIETAAQSLKTGGTLWMVANVQLPYEDALATNFTRVNKVFQGEGFKVFEAAK